jgi:hypothetical protein
MPDEWGLDNPEPTASETPEQAEQTGVEAQQTTTTETSAPPPEEQPKMYAGKFKSPEELQKGYEELERAYLQKQRDMTQLSQQFASLKKQAAPPQEQPPVQTEDIDAVIRDALQRDPFGTMSALVQHQLQTYVQPIQATAREIKIRDAVSQMTATYPDFPEVAGGIKQMMETNPDMAELFERNPAFALDLAYKAAKVDAVAKALPQVVELATQQAYQNITAKQGVTPVPPAAKQPEKPKDPDSEMWEAVAKAGPRSVWRK